MSNFRLCHICEQTPKESRSFAAEDRSGGLLDALDRTVSQMFATRRRWTEDEDCRLRDAVAAHGTAQWADIERAFGGGRSAEMCRERWHYHLRDAANNPQRVRRQEPWSAPKPSGGHSLKARVVPPLLKGTFLPHRL
jgi:hypothetical protein